MKSAARANISALIHSARGALACVLMSTCAAMDGSVQATTTPTCGPNCRVLPDGHPPEHPECRESADCGERPNTQRTMCIAGHVCEPACAARWADCNRDYRDACETPSKDGRCKGDEAFVTDPLVFLSCVRESSLSEHCDCDLLTPATHAPAKALDACYRRVLSGQPGAEDTIDFAVTVNSDGRVSEVKLLASESTNAALQACARDAIEDLHVRSDKSAQVGATYPVRAVFVSHE